MSVPVPFAASLDWAIAVPVAVVLIVACVVALVFLRRHAAAGSAASGAADAGAGNPVTPQPAERTERADPAEPAGAAPQPASDSFEPELEPRFQTPAPEPHFHEPAPVRETPLQTEGVGEGVSRVRDDTVSGGAVLAVVVESTVDVPDVRLTGVPTAVYFADDPDPGQADADLEALADVAKRRAATVAGLERGQFQAFIGIATQIVLDGRVLARPEDPAAARSLLAELSGAEHELRSAVAVVSEHGLSTADVTTTVQLRRLSTADIDRYVATGEWVGRQGGYDPRRQGRWLIARVDGDIQNLRGWPYGAVMEAFSSHLSRETPASA